MTDIAERLRRQVSESPYDGFVSPLEAAAEIERLRAALLEIVATCQAVWDEDIPDDASECEVRVDDAIADAWRTAAGIARRALEGKYE